MGQQQFLLIVVGVIIVGLAIAVGIALFTAQTISSNRDAMINDLTHLAIVAYQYRTSLRTMGGGEGDYTSFVIPLSMSTNNNGTYSITDVQVDALTIRGVSANDSTNGIVVIVNKNGKLGNLTFAGDFQ